MFNSITIYDFNNINGGNKVVATNAMNQIVSLTGVKAKNFLLQNYFKGYYSSNDSDSGILPPGVRFIGQNYVVFERPPTYQNIFYHPERVHSEMNNNNISVYRVPLPWQIYVATFTSDYYLSDVRMYFSPTSLSTLDQHVYLPQLPNFYTNGLLCRPFIAEMEDIERYQKNLSGIIACAYDWVWNNGTNNDLNEAMVHLNLQVVAREGSENTLFSKMPEDNYRLLFRNPYGIHYYTHQHVVQMFEAWEKFTIEECMNFKWPVPSMSKHFDNIYYYQTGNPESVTENSNYYNWLSEWAREYYDEHSEEDIEYMIDNDEWDGEAYFEYVTKNYLPIKPIEFNPVTLREIVSLVNSEVVVPSIKNLVNTLVTNAILLDGTSTQNNDLSI